MNKLPKISRKEERERQELLKQEKKLKKKQPRRWHDQKYRSRINLQASKRAAAQAIIDFEYSPNELKTAKKHNATRKR